MQIESCANTLEDANSQLEIAKRQIDLAQKNYDLTNDSYKLGRETQLNLLTAENSLRTAKLDYMSAIVEWNKAYNALLQATGLHHDVPVLVHQVELVEPKGDRTVIELNNIKINQ